MNNLTCANCGESFQHKDVRTKYCSHNCFQNAKNERQRLARSQPITERICSVCKKKFMPILAIQKRCDECRVKNRSKMSKKQQAKRNHVASVSMAPNVLHIESMGHLANQPEPEAFNVEKNSPKLSNCYKRVKAGKSTYFPETKDKFNRLINRLTDENIQFTIA